MTNYFDIMMTLLCCLTAANIITLLWVAIRIEQVREKVEEVLRWM